MSDSPRYVTLQDYLRVLRVQAPVIVLTVVAFGAAAYLYSALQTPTYSAKTLLNYRESTQDFDLVGQPVGIGETSEQRAATNAETITQPAIAARVKRALGTGLSEQGLLAAVEAQNESTTNLVSLEARGTDPAFTARLANEFARQGGNFVTERARKRYQAAAGALKRESRRVGKSLELTALSERISRLLAFARFADPVETVRPASVPSSPDSPKTLLNTGVGLFVGLALGTVAAFLLDSLDRRLRSSREIDDHLELPLLGHVGHRTMGRAPSGTNGRPGLSEADMEAFRILRTNLDFVDLEHPLRSLAVTSAGPQEGKSTVAASLAFTYAAAGKRTLLVECDIRRPSLAGQLGLSASPGLTDCLIGRAGVEDVVQGVGLASPLAGDSVPPSNHDRAVAAGSLLTCITAGSSVTAPGEVLGSPRFRDLLGRFREAYEMVLLDTGPLLSVGDTLPLLPHVDGVLLCVRASYTTRDQARAVRAAVAHLPARLTGYVVTGLRPGDQVEYGFYSPSSTYATVKG